MKTPFEEDLNDFLYADTCEIEVQEYYRNAQGVFLNISKESRYVLSNFLATAGQAVVPLLFVGLCSLVVSNSDGRLANERKILKAHSSRSMRLDEKGRQELVLKLSRARNYYSLTQEEMADLLGISKFTISKMERGEHHPDARSMDKYNTFLSLTDYLKEKLHGKKYAIRELFHMNSRLFGNMTASEFAKTIGEEGLDEVVSVFKRQYG